METSYRSTKLACYIGYVVQAIINNFLPLLFVTFQNRYDLSYEQLGRIIFINFFTQIFADYLTPKIVKILGYKGSAIACHALASLGLILLSFLPNVINNVYAGIIIPVIVYAFGSGIIEVVISPMMNIHSSSNKTSGMAFLHSFYCWGQALTILVTTLMIRFTGEMYWNIVPLLWAVIPLCNMIFFITVPVIEPETEENKGQSKEMFKTREFWCFVIFMICAGASEIAMCEWASVFAQNALKVSKTVGDLLGPCAFAIFMGTGRILFGLFSNRISYRKVLIINNLLCCVCYLIVAFCKIPIFALLACAFCGFTVSISWPGTLSIASAYFPKGGTLMFSMFALSGDLGCSSGPWVLGFIADRLGLESGFLVCSVFPLIMVFAALFLINEKTVKY